MKNGEQMSLNGAKFFILMLCMAALSACDDSATPATPSSAGNTVNSGAGSNPSTVQDCPQGNAPIGAETETNPPLAFTDLPQGYYVEIGSSAFWGGPSPVFVWQVPQWIGHIDAEGDFDGQGNTQWGVQCGNLGPWLQAGAASGGRISGHSILFPYTFRAPFWMKISDQQNVSAIDEEFGLVSPNSDSRPLLRSKITGEAYSCTSLETCYKRAGDTQFFQLPNNQFEAVTRIKDRLTRADDILVVRFQWFALSN